MIVILQNKIEMIVLRLKMIYLFKNLIYYIKRSRREKKKKKNRYKKIIFKYESSERSFLTLAFF